MCRKANSAFEAPEESWGKVRARRKAKRKRSLFGENNCFSGSESRAAPVKRKRVLFPAKWKKGKLGGNAVFSPYGGRIFFMN